MGNEATCQDLRLREELDKALARYNDLFVTPKLVLLDRAKTKKLLDRMDEIDNMVFPPGDSKIRGFWEEKNHLIHELRGLLKKAV